MHFLLCIKHKLQLYTFQGMREREWAFAAEIKFIKVIGGPSGREGLLVGLESGAIFKVFVNNSFPIPLVTHKASVKCLDISASLDKIAVVDDDSNVTTYSLKTGEKLFEEANATAVAWNTELDDMLCFSGNGACLPLAVASSHSRHSRHTSTHTHIHVHTHAHTRTHNRTHNRTPTCHGTAAATAAAAVVAAAAAAAIATLHPPPPFPPFPPPSAPHCMPGVLSIKTQDFPLHTQRQQGVVVGFSGSRIFALQYTAMVTIDVPQSASFYRYLEKRDFVNAYEVRNTSEQR